MTLGYLKNEMATPIICDCKKNYRQFECVSKLFKPSKNCFTS
jgi:hypothetical protein